MPSEWLNDVRQADEDGLLALTQHLPAEAAEAILELATGGTPRLQPAMPVPDPFVHPDAQRRFRVVTSVEELERALDSPWDKWAVFLHPEQCQLVTHEYAGPARVAGSAGTGKTVVALHRAVHLARANPDGRILLATFSEPLAHALRANVKRLIGNEPRVAERLEVHAMTTLGIRLHQAQLGPVRLASKEVAAFATLGFEVCESGDAEPGLEKVAIYVGDSGEPEHMARQLPSGGWTSKMGCLLEDIEHVNLAVLEGTEYGTAKTFLARPDNR